MASPYVPVTLHRMKLNSLQKWCVFTALSLIIIIYFLVPMAKPEKQKADNQRSSAGNAPLIEGYSTDTVLAMSRARLNPTQLQQAKKLEAAVPSDTSDKQKNLECLS